MKRIALITHCEATHSVEEKVGGWFDSSLTDRGQTQAGSLVFKLHKLNFDVNLCPIYSSDLQRAAQTARIISTGTANEPILDARLREMSFGTHEGMPQAKHNQLMKPVSSTGNRLDHRICEGAETRREVAIRIKAFVDEVMQTDEDLIVVTHGFAATFFIAAFQQIDIESQGYINYKLLPGSISLLEEDDLFRNRSLSILNAT